MAEQKGNRQPWKRKQVGPTHRRVYDDLRDVIAQCLRRLHGWLWRPRCGHGCGDISTLPGLPVHCSAADRHGEVIVLALASRPREHDFKAASIAFRPSLFLSLPANVCVSTYCMLRSIIA